MQFGIFNFSRSPYTEIARRIQEAEALGFDSAWVNDDLLVPEYGDLEPWTLLGALARDTSRIRLGTMVSAISFRHPTFLASQVISLDLISDGRANLGLGAGGASHPNGAFGQATWGARERAERLEEQAAILAPLLRGETVNVDGKHYTVTDATMPAAIQTPRPRLIVAAHGERALRVAARYGDGWNSMAGIVFPEPDPPRALSLMGVVAETKRLSGRLDQICAEIGRDPESLRRSVLVLNVTPEPFSSLDAFDAVVGAYADIGIEELILYWPPVDLALPSRLPVPVERQAMYERIASERILDRQIGS